MGEELSGLDGKLFQDYLAVLRNSVTEATVVGVGNIVRENQVYMAVPAEDGRLFEILRNTLLSVVINNFMSKFPFPWNCKITFLVPAADHSSFLMIESIYCEPFMVNNQYRVMLEIGPTYSIYAHGLPRMTQRVSSNLVCPAVLNKSL